MTEQMDGQVSLFAQDTWYGRTCRERSAPTTEKTLPQSSKKRPKSRSRKSPLFLYLKRDGPQADASWEPDGALLGEYSTHSFGESHRDGVESHLSQILEASPHPKYYLVQKAYSEHVRWGDTIVMLIPARTDTSYFHDYIYGKAEIRFLRGRLKFEDENRVAMNPAPFPSMVVIFR